MTATTRRRAITLRLALLTLVAGATLFFSPNVVQRAYAFDENRCTANCANGSCSATGNCTCTCTFWTSTARCTCGGQEESTGPDDPTHN